MRTLKLVRDYIKSFESLKLTAYLCPSSVWTIGFGTTIYPNYQRVKEGDKCTIEQAEEYFNHNINEIEKFLNNKIKLIVDDLTDYEYSALVSLIYNIGSGNFEHSKVFYYLQRKDHWYAANSFLDHIYAWDKNKKCRVKLKGLEIRRKKEVEIFNYNKYEKVVSKTVKPIEKIIDFNFAKKIIVKGLTKIYNIKENILVMPKYLDERIL